MKRKEYAPTTKSIEHITHTHTHRPHTTENVFEYCRTYLLKAAVKSQQYVQYLYSNTVKCGSKIQYVRYSRYLEYLAHGQQQVP
jgi:hypothetical protein